MSRDLNAEAKRKHPIGSKVLWKGSECGVVCGYYPAIEGEIRYITNHGRESGFNVYSTNYSSKAELKPMSFTIKFKSQIELDGQMVRVEGRYSATDAQNIVDKCNQISAIFSETSNKIKILQFVEEIYWRRE